MEILRGIITKASTGYDSVSNTFTLLHGVPNVKCVPYNFSIMNQDGDFESIEVSSVEFDEYRIKVYFGSLEIGDNDEIAYSFGIIFGENSNSDSFSWENASKVASIARPIAVQYSGDGVIWFNRAMTITKALRFSHDGGETWGNAVFVGNTDDVICSIPNSTITVQVPYDGDEDLIKLMFEFCSNEDFIEDDSSDSNSEYARRVYMDRDNDIMKISSNGVMVPVPDGGLGLPYYGQIVSFTLDNNRFPWYHPGHTYYCRWRWTDSRGASQDWNNAKFTYDINGVCSVDRTAQEEPVQSNSSSVSNGHPVIGDSSNSNSGLIGITVGSSITLPVPFDNNGDNIKLIIGFCSNEDFASEDVSNSDSCSNADFVRYVCMGEDNDVFKVSSNGSFLDVPQEGLGIPYYGQTVVMTLSNNRFKWYHPGKTYFARARWTDSNGASTDWSMFKVTYDFGDVQPIKTENTDSNVEINNDVTSFVVDYFNGKTQVFNLSGSATLNISEITSIPFGMDMSLIINVPSGSALTVVGTSTNTYNQGKYIVRVIMLDSLIATVSEVI